MTYKLETWETEAWHDRPWTHPINEAGIGLTIEDVPVLDRPFLTKRWTKCTLEQDETDGMPLVVEYEGDDADEIDESALAAYLQKMRFPKIGLR